MAEWKTCTIGDLCDTISETYRRNDSEVVLINTSDVLDGKVLNHKKIENRSLKGQFKKTFQKNDILYSEIRPANKRFAFIDFKETEQYIASTKLMVLRANQEIVRPKFLFSILKSSVVISELQLLAETRSGTFPQITFSAELAPMKIMLPDFDTQDRIVSIIDSIEEKIELNNTINNNLLEQLNQLFADFSTRNEWKYISIGEIAEKVAMGPFGSNIKVSTFVESGVPIISGNHLRGYFLEEPSYNYITEEHAEKLRNSVVYTKDIVFTHAGNIGQVAMIPAGCEYPYYVLSQRQFYLRCNINVAIPEYILLFFHSKQGQHELLSYANQTGVPSIAQPASNLKKICLPLPPIEAQREWLSIVEPIIAMYQNSYQETQQLSALRDALLPRLMSGELDVSDIEL
ncbi:MAG: restriction endonuclease subunit S [Ruminococcus sp.]|nr:restriction endonuclease subunit S [Ruminococcus sp.]